MAERDIRTLKFMKRFEGKMRYITKETGLLGALFPNTNIENLPVSNRVPKKNDILAVISESKRTKKQRQKILSHRDRSNVENIR